MSSFVERHAVLELQVAGLTQRGDGVARRDGFAVFVPGALPGETVRARVTEVRTSYARAALQEIVQPAVARTVPPCAIAGICGGCALQHLSRSGQLQWKRQFVVDALTRIGKLDASEVEARVAATVDVADQWNYRDKVTYRVDVADGRRVGGFVCAGTHDIVAAPDCLIAQPAHSSLLACVLAAVDAAGELDRSELETLAKVVVRIHDGGALVIVVARDAADAAGAWARLGARVLDMADGASAPVTGIALMTSPDLRSSNAASSPSHSEAHALDEVEAGSLVPLWGSTELSYEVLGLRLRVSATAFAQVNRGVAAEICRRALAAAHLQPGDTVFDVYCGVGAMAILAAGQGRVIYGIETDKAAIADARVNAERAGAQDIALLCALAEDELPRLQAAGIRPDVVFLDPPRAGCDRRVLEVILATQPRSVVYISCDPATLARDVRRLAEGGYRLVDATPLDAFPQTGHVECVVGLVRG